MATATQMRFVTDVEAACAAIKQRPAGKVSLSEVCRLSDFTAQELRIYAERLGNKGEIELLQRLQAALASIELTSVPVNSALSRALDPGYEAPEPEKEPMVWPEPAVAPAPVSVPQAFDFPSLVTQCLRIFEPLPLNVRKRLIMTLATSYEVGG